MGCSFDRIMTSAQVTVVSKPLPAFLSRLDSGGLGQGSLEPDSFQLSN